MNIWNIYYKIEYLFITSISYIFYILSLIPIPRLDFIQLYILVTFTIVGIFFYIKLRYPFWNVQPIYHSYDYWRRWYKTSFVIQKGLPLKTKFTDLINVTVIDLVNITDEHLKNCIDILQTSYIQSDKVLLTLEAKNLRSWISGTSGTPLLSLYNDITYTITENKEIIQKQIPIGCMFSKPMTFYYLQTGNREDKKIGQYIQAPIYYWDYICILKEHKHKNFSRKLIQTAEYIQRMRNPEIQISLFRKELALCEGVIPLVKYNSYTYYLRNISVQKLPPHFIVAHVTQTSNKDLLANFLGGISSPDMPKIFDIMCISSLSNILEMIKDWQLYCFCLRMGNNIYAVYFFKDENVLYEDIEQGHTIKLIASVNNTTNNELFFAGFMHCIQMIIKNNRKRKRFQMIMIDETSHNKGILNIWNQKFSKIMETPSAYYSYNFFYPKTPILAEKFLVIQ